MHHGAMRLNIRRPHRPDHGERIAVVRRWPDTVVAVISAAAAAVASGVILSTFRNDHSGSSLGAGILAGVAAWLIWNVAARSRVVVWSAGVEVVNGFVRHWLPWSTIDMVQSRGDVIIRLRDGSHVRPLSSLGSPVGAFFGARHGPRASALIDAQRHQQSGALEAPRQRGIRLGLPSLVVIGAFITLVATTN